MPTTRRALQKTSQSRVFTIEDRAAPNHVPVYQTLARMAGVTHGQGDVTLVRIPDPNQYGRFIVVDKIQGQADSPQTSLEFRAERNVRSPIYRVVKKGCEVDVQLHIGDCKDPSDFDLGWDKILVFEGALFTNYQTDDQGTFDADGNNPVTETVDVSADDFYEIMPMAFSQIGESTILQKVVDVAICDARSCGACGLPSDGCQKVFAVTVAVGASPGLTSQLVFTKDGGATISQTHITSLPANKDATALACVGPYLGVISNGDSSFHYAKITDILAGTESWTKVTSGITASTADPKAIISLGRTHTWIAAEGGYVYFSADVTSGFTAQTSGDVTASDLNAITALDEKHLLAVGASNAIITTKDGATWLAVTGPSAQAGVAATACAMLSESEWQVGYADGELWYTYDSGVSWTQKSLPGSLTQVDDIVYATRTVGYITGRTSDPHGKLLRTINGGQSWYVLPENTGLSIPTSDFYLGIAACGDDVNLLWAGGTDDSGTDGLLVKGTG